MSSASAASAQDYHSGFQPVDAGTPDKIGIADLLPHLTRQTASWSVHTWQKLPRKTRILLNGLLIISCSFGLSMIVSVLSR